MIDLKKDIGVTLHDVELQKKLNRKQSRSLSMDEYLEFLWQLQQIFPGTRARRHRRDAFDRPFELPRKSCNYSDGITMLH
ncbi:hypothetical protein JW979_10050 [bacterium]|nr:hypothetical protein [candidate division CSSED10-310 bacterium]